MHKKELIVAPILICLVVTGCHHSGSSSTPTPITIIATPGPWSGTYTLGNGNVAVNGVVTPDGFGYFADNNGYVFELAGLSDTSPFTTTLSGYAPRAQTFTDGNTILAFTASGTYSSVSAGTTIQANISSDNINGSFNLTSDSPFTGTASIAGLQGSWSGDYIGKAATSLTVSFNATGAFTGNDGYGCQVSGTFTQQAPSINQYYVTFDTVGPSCPGSMNGLGYESSQDTSGVFGGATGTYLYMGLFSANVAYTVELKL